MKSSSPDLSGYCCSSPKRRSIYMRWLNVLNPWVRSAVAAINSSQPGPSAHKAAWSLSQPNTAWSTVALVLLGTSWVSATATNAPLLTMSGEVRSELYQSNIVYHVETNRFTAWISNSSCRIVATVPDIPVVEHFEFSSDGTNSTETAFFDPQRLTHSRVGVFRGHPENTTSEIPIRPHSHGHLKAAPWPMPSEATGVLLPIWLAYCSSEALDRALNTPLFFPDFFRGKRVAIRSQEERNSNYPHVLSKFIEFDPGFYYEIIPNSFLRVKTAHNKPFHRGFTNAVYEVTAWTNVAGLMLPRAFTVVTFTVPARDSGVGALWVRGRYSFFLERADCGPLYPPSTEPPAKLRISEFRFVHERPRVDDFDYLVTNGILPSKSEVRQLEAYSTALKRTKGLAGNSRFRTWFGAAMICAVVFPVTAILVRKVRR